MAQSKTAAQQSRTQHNAYLNNPVIKSGKAATVALKLTPPKQTTVPNSLNDAANHEFGTTAEAAHIVRKMPQTLRKANSQQGHFMGVIPNKDPETRTLYWNLTLLRTKVAGVTLPTHEPVVAVNNASFDSSADAA